VFKRRPYLQMLEESSAAGVGLGEARSPWIGGWEIWKATKLTEKISRSIGKGGATR